MISCLGHLLGCARVNSQRNVAFHDCLLKLKWLAKPVQKYTWNVLYTLNLFSAEC